MLEFNREIIKGSFNKVNKASKEVDCININVREKDKSVDVKFTGKGIWAAGIIAVVPYTVLLLGAAITTREITKIISKRKKAKEEVIE